MDDNRDGLLIRTAVLEEAGFEVQTANGGPEGLDRFCADHFDVVVTDYRMPVMNGVELIGRIRTVEANARIILLSGFLDPLGLTEANTGADVVIAKSAHEGTHLVRAVKRLTGRPARKSPARQESLRGAEAAKNTAGKSGTL
ncbi:MAG TPA: response regulator [Bryobacteraceae bacterium]|nr:response regulator [Bryobacteraceae bacterium]